jgi:hypothetical protein
MAKEAENLLAMSSGVKRVETKNVRKEDEFEAKMKAAGVLEVGYRRTNKGKEDKSTAYLTLSQEVLQEEEDNGGNANQLVLKAVATVRKDKQGDYKMSSFGFGISGRRKDKDEKEWVWTRGIVLRPEQMRLLIAEGGESVAVKKVATDAVKPLKAIQAVLA